MSLNAKAAGSTEASMPLQGIDVEKMTDELGGSFTILEKRLSLLLEWIRMYGDKLTDSDKETLNKGIDSVGEAINKAKASTDTPAELNAQVAEIENNLARLIDEVIFPVIKSQIEHGAIADSEFAEQTYAKLLHQITSVGLSNERRLELVTMLKEYLPEFDQDVPNEGEGGERAIEDVLVEEEVIKGLIDEAIRTFTTIIQLIRTSTVSHEDKRHMERSINSMGGNLVNMIRGISGVKDRKQLQYVLQNIDNYFSRSIVGFFYADDGKGNAAVAMRMLQDAGVWSNVRRSMQELSESIHETLNPIACDT